MTQNHKRFLVTTSDERTWPEDESIIFLNERCLKYERTHVWSKLNGKVNQQPILSFQQRINLKKLENDLFSELFPILVGILNEYHKKTFSVRFWKILIGHWFQKYVSLILNQKLALELILDTENVFAARFIHYENHNLIPRDLNDMIKLHTADSYNSAIDLKIVSSMNRKDFTVEEINVNFKKEFSNFKITENQDDKIHVWLNTKVRNLIQSFVRDSEPYIGSTYLPLVEELKLQASFLVTPKNWRRFLTHDVKAHPNWALRESLKESLMELTGRCDMDIVYSLIFELIPIVYLEGLSELFDKLDSLNLPKYPKFIFTSNDYFNHEVFKLYAAFCTEQGIKYFVGQHGNNYGTHLFTNPTIEESTSDRFLTWGWEDDPKKHVPSFIFKKPKNKIIGAKSDSLLLVQFPLSLNILESNLNFQPNLYFSDQIKLIRAFDNIPLENIVVRLSNSTVNSVQLDAKKFTDYFPEIKIDYGTSNISKVISQSRLIIFSYDSTGILENLSLNIPTLAFWQNGLDHLNSNAKKDYQELLEAGIIHLSPESAANKVNQIWDDVETWWGSVSVQAARANFCSKYARTSNNPVRDLRKILKKNL
jgi:putative transferase (TIGR04331 family)